MVYIFFDKKTAAGAIKKENMSKKELAEELHKPIIRNFKKRKVYLHLKAIFGVLIVLICN